MVDAMALRAHVVLDDHWHRWTPCGHRLRISPTSSAAGSETTSMGCGAGSLEWTARSWSPTRSCWCGMPDATLGSLWWGAVVGFEADAA